MASVTALADEYWTLRKHHEPYYAVLAGEPPGPIEPVNETTIAAQSAEARRLLERLRTTQAMPGEEDLAAVLATLLAQQAARIDQMWHIHPTAPYQSNDILMTAQQVIAPQPEPQRTRLTGELATRIRSIADLVRQQRSRAIILPRPSVSGARVTWTRLSTQLPKLLHDDDIGRACGEVIQEIDASAELAGDKVGLANLPGGEEVYRAFVRHETTLDMDPEQLHRLGLEQCAQLSERMAQVRARLGGPVNEEEARDWITAQPHLYAGSPDDVAAIYRRHIERIEPMIATLFRIVPQAGYDVRRADPAVEAGMTFGYYQPPTSDEPLGLYRFNGSSLDKRSQLSAAALIFHELVPGHHFHLARQNENTALHPLQQHSLELAAFNEGWGEYASGLGWELGAYEDDWDAYGRLSHERFTAQRLVVDTALNLGWWDLDRAQAFMRTNTLQDDRQIATEVLRYATDMPAQALAYRSGYLAFCQARESASGLDLRDLHEAMIGSGAVPLPHMHKQVTAAAQSVDRNKSAGTN